jgi:hypothetical protein
MRFIEVDALTKKPGESRFDITIGKMVIRGHSDQNVKMISHNAKTQHLGKIQQAEPFDHINYSVFIGILKWESIQGGPGHDMVNRSLIRD